LVEGKSLMLEEYARKLVHDEEVHLSEIKKMLPRAGKTQNTR